MRWYTSLLLALATTLGLVPTPLQAEGWLVKVTITEEWIDESDPRFHDSEPVDQHFEAESDARPHHDNDDILALLRTIYLDMIRQNARRHAADLAAA